MEVAKISEIVKRNRIVRVLSRFVAENSVIVAFIIIVLFASIARPGFMTTANIINILRQVSIIGIISLGMTLIIISGGIDLSVGSALVLIGAMTIAVMNATNNIYIALLAALAGGAAIGFINGVIITKGKITPFITTLGVMAACRSLSLYLLNGGGISSNLSQYGNISNGDLFGMSYPAYYFIIMTVIVFVFSKKTPLGRYIYAIGSNEKASHLSAINVNRIKVITYMIGGVLVALSSIIETSRLNSVSAASSGMNYELDAIAAVIIGGTRMSGGKGSVIGTFFGVLILGILSNMLTLLGVSPFLAGTVKAAIIILSVLIQRKE